ncbi:histidine ammonia-lyase [Estrella lausannensis]|nr:histidine ammonia-lyase [Estrella lausannensis]
MPKKAILLSGSALTLNDLIPLAEGAPFSLCEQALEKVNSARVLVEKIAKKGKPCYGVNTGFGLLAKEAIPPSQQKKLQLNIIRSHAAGFGEPLSRQECRLAAILRLNVLLKGRTGSTPSLCQAFATLIQRDVIPCIPSRGSVGASGDLAPLSHLALPLIGEGEAYYRGKIVPAGEALKKAGLKPVVLQEKEGLGLINGTQVMIAVGGMAAILAKSLAHVASKIAALTFEGFEGNVEALHPFIHKERNQPGQISAAQAILEELRGSYLMDKSIKHRFVQDPYSLRCAPQVHGASLDFLSFALKVVERELSAATDNPLVFAEEERVLSGGNFHGEPLALAFDTAALAIAEIANISERRLDLLLNPQMSGLNAFLAKNPGLESGYMAAQYLAASLVAENKVLAHPASVDSIPGNAGIEDHVSMGMTAALKLKNIVKNVKAVLAVELIAAAQAADLRGISKKLGKGTSATYKRLRQKVPPLNEDRIVSLDINESNCIIEEMTKEFV